MGVLNAPIVKAGVRDQRLSIQTNKRRITNEPGVRDKRLAVRVVPHAEYTGTPGIIRNGHEMKEIQPKEMTDLKTTYVSPARYTP